MLPADLPGRLPSPRNHLQYSLMSETNHWKTQELPGRSLACSCILCGQQGEVLLGGTVQYGPAEASWCATARYVNQLTQAESSPEGAEGSTAGLSAQR